MSGEHARASDGSYQRWEDGYREARLAHDPGRAAVWRAIAEDLERRFLGDARCVLELGCGWGDLVNALRAPRRIAVDLADARPHLAPGVEFVQGDCADLRGIADGAVDAVVASNLLEHLSREAAARLLGEVRRVLRPGGRLVLIQPNFRLCYPRYFDDYTHETVYTDESLCGLLTAHGLRVLHRVPGYLPFSMRSRLPRSYWLTRLFLACGSPLLGKQMLVVAERP